MRSIAGLHPVERVPDVENVDVTTTVPGHLQYRAFMPLVLDELGFKTTADYFDEPEDLDNVPDREVVREALESRQEEEETKKVKNSSGGFGRIFKRNKAGQAGVGDGSMDSSQSSTPPRRSSATANATDEYEYDDDDLPPRELEQKAAADALTLEPVDSTKSAEATAPAAPFKHLAVDTVRKSSELVSARSATPEAEKPPSLAVHFDTEAMLAELRSSGIEVRELESSLPPLVASNQARRAETAPGSTLPRKLQTLTAVTTRDDARRLTEPTAGHDPTSTAPVEPPRRPSATPTPYAHSFSESPFSRLPPPAPPAMMTEDSMGGVSLSFADSYSDEEDASAPPQSAESETAAVSLDVAQGYGLSSDAARELARRFNDPDSRNSHDDGSRTSNNEGGAAPYLPVEDDAWRSRPAELVRDGRVGIADVSTSDNSSKDHKAAIPALNGNSPWSTPSSSNPFAYDDEGQEEPSGDIGFSTGVQEAHKASRPEALTEPPRSLSFGRLALDDTGSYTTDAQQVRSPASRNPSSSAWEADNPWG